MAGERLSPGTQTVASPVLPGGITNASITTATARPYSTAVQDVDTGLTLELINRKLQIEGVLDSVFVPLSSEIAYQTGKKIPVPDTCITKIKIERGAKTLTIPMVQPLVGSARVGTDQKQEGYERDRTLTYMKVYYNEYSYGVIGEKWGMNFNEHDYLGYYQEIQPQMSTWIAEDKDKQIHEALLESYSYVLEATGTALTQTYNRNWFIANLVPGDQPTYSSTPATFRTNINTALAQAATGTYGVNANIDLDYLLALDTYANIQKRIKPVMIGGKKSFVVLLPSSQYLKLLSDTEGQMGSVWTKVTQLSAEEQNYPGILGRVKSLVIVEDYRYPTLKCTNSYGDNTHTVEYVNPGNQDSRNFSVYEAASNAAWDIGFLLGAGAVIESEVTAPHFETTDYEYGKIYGKSVFAEGAYQLGQTFDTDTASNLNMKNFGSIVLAFTAATTVKVA